MDFFDREEIVVEDFVAKGFILDIGGGGEGVIGQMKGSQVVSIDLSKRELEGAPAGPLKIVMDATELKFLDGSFETVTAFFSFMYMGPEVREKALKEIHRVLVPGGRFLLWDPIVPVAKDPKKEYAVFRYLFKLPGTTVRTGYGTPYRDYVRDAVYHIGFGERAGFKVAKRRDQGRTFFVEFTRA
jgi:ubiquinone/menaquinone biosynthesis C-methylase UbiE